jgi:hypothetical protein
MPPSAPSLRDVGRCPLFVERRRFAARPIRADGDFLLHVGYLQHSVDVHDLRGQDRDRFLQRQETDVRDRDGVVTGLDIGNREPSLRIRNR